MRRHVLLCVEGPHDEAVLGRLLRHAQLSRVRDLDGLADTSWGDLVPRSFPVKDLVARHPVPAFYSSERATVAILFGAGSGWPAQLGDSLQLLRKPVDAVGVLVDADQAPTASLQKASAELQRMKLAPGAHGEVVVGANGSADCGIYVVPGGGVSGTMEDVLLAAGERVYGKALRAAQGLVDEALTGALDIPSAEQKELRAPLGKKKSSLAITSSLLKPGKAIQNSISDNRWISGALDEPLVAALNGFLASLLRTAD
jgi:hypothetical protein